jgi:hypothetical protein
MNVDFQRYRIDWCVAKFNLEVFGRLVESCMGGDWNDPER